MFIDSQAATGIAPEPTAGAPAPGVGDTRVRVLQHVVEHGPVTAAQVADVLELTPTAVRRHLENLTESGDVEPTAAGPGATRGRGRPARTYVVAPEGHRRLASQEADVATAALRFLSDRVGDDAVADFARDRFAEFERRYDPVVERAGDDVVERSRALAAALTADGYAASTRPVGIDTPLEGVQLCQGHCPVHGVARDFPQFCEAETQAIARLLGVHVQRLATLAGGGHVCTTFVPNPPPRPGDDSGSSRAAPDPPDPPTTTPTSTHHPMQPPREADERTPR